MLSSRKAGFAVAGAAAVGTCIYLYMQSGGKGDAPSKETKASVKTNGTLNDEISNTAAKTTVDKVPPKAAMNHDNTGGKVATISDTKSDPAPPLPSTKPVPKEPRKNAPVDDLSDSWEKVVGKASDSTPETATRASNHKEEQSLYATVESAESFGIMEDEENINLQTDAAAVAKMRSAAMKKKKGKKTTTAAEVAKKEMQSAPVAAKKKKKKVR